jgi:hypothetical protein
VAAVAAVAAGCGVVCAAVFRLAGKKNAKGSDQVEITKYISHYSVVMSGLLGDRGGEWPVAMALFFSAFSYPPNNQWLGVQLVEQGFGTVNPKPLCSSLLLTSHFLFKSFVTRSRSLSLGLLTSIHILFVG